MTCTSKSLRAARLVFNPSNGQAALSETIGAKLTTSHYIDELTAQVDAELKAIVNERGFPLYDMMAYHLGWRGAHSQDVGLPRRQERMHGVFTLLACAAVGGDVDACLPAAAAIELVDKFAEIHDDVQEGNPQRNERDAVWWVWGPAQAINAGDGMHALGRLALLRLADRGVPDERVFDVVRLVDRASLRACEGRFRDLEAQERIDLTVEAYTRMAAEKAGALLGCAMQIGALAGGSDAATGNALAACGEKLGIALQVRSDLAALWGGDGDDNSPPNVEVLNKKKLIPVVYALENATISEKRAMGEIYFKRVLESDDAMKLRDVIDGLGARAACEEMADTLKAEALADLQIEGVAPAGNSRIREYIEMLTEGR